jgi:hypothetical protein
MKRRMSRSRRGGVQLAKGFDAGLGWPAGPVLGSMINSFPFIVKFKYVNLKIPCLYIKGLL